MKLVRDVRGFGGEFFTTGRRVSLSVTRGDRILLRRRSCVWNLRREEDSLSFCSRGVAVDSTLKLSYSNGTSCVVLHLEIS